MEGDGSLAGVSAEVALQLVVAKCPRRMGFDLSTLPVLAAHHTQENEHVGVEAVYLQKQGCARKLDVLAERVEETLRPPHPSYRGYREAPALATNDFTMFLAKASQVSGVGGTIWNLELGIWNLEFGV